MKDKRVVITGAGGGIGQALVKKFVHNGAHVIACDKEEQALADLVGIRARIVFDLLDKGSIETAATRIIKDFGAPDCLVNNAGATRAERLADVTDMIIDTELTLNLAGVMRLSQNFLSSMKIRGGSLFFISSINALQHFCDPVYSAAKAGIAAYARAIAVEYGHYQIRSNIVAPGSTHTPAWYYRFTRDPELAKNITTLFPLRRMVSVEEVAEAAFFLASPLSSGITGVTLPVDAGATAGSLPFINMVANKDEK